MNQDFNNSVQFEYFSEKHNQFVKDFYKYCATDTLLTFLSDDILYHLVKTKKNYFRINRDHSRDNQHHYFFFEKNYTRENSNIIRYSYIGHSYNDKL